MIFLHQLAWAAVCVYTYYRERKYVLLNPLFHIGLMSLIFTSRIPEQRSYEVGIALIVTSIMLNIGYHLKTSFKTSGSIYSLPLNYSERTRVIFICVCIGFTILPMYGMIRSGVDVYDILFKFRNAIDTEYNEGGFVIKSFAGAFGYFPIWGIIIGRIWFHKYRESILRVLWYILVVLHVFTRISTTGTRGAILIIFAGIVLVDLLWERKTRTKVFSRNVIAYMLIVVFVVIVTSFLTVYRNTKMEDVNQMRDAVFNVVSFNVDKQAFKMDNSLRLNDEIAFTIDKWADEPSCLKGVYAQIVNPIPRFLWSNKPSVFGKVLASERFGVPLEGKGSFGFAAGIAGESIYNAGYIGLLIFPVIFGLLFKSIWVIINYSENEIKLATAIMFLSWSYAIVRGDWCWGINIPLYNALLAMCVLSVINGIMTMVNR